MQYFFSKSTMGFYVDDVHGDNMPPDVVQLETEEYHGLLAGQASGKLLCASDDGFPYLSETSKPEITYAQLRVSEYPDIYEYIDGIVKGDQEQVEAYISACKAVKEKYPKQ